MKVERLIVPAVWFVAFAASAAGEEPKDVPTLSVADFGKIEDWPGFTKDTEHVKLGVASAKWTRMDKTPHVSSKAIPHDWSKFNHLKLWVYSERAVDTAFMIIASSENPETKGPDYYGFRIPLDFAGWKEFDFVLRRKKRVMQGARSPLGMDRIQSLTFTASGWGNTPDPRATVYINGLRLTLEPLPTGPLTTDAEFFGSLDPSVEGMSKVTAAYRSGDVAAANRELLNHMRSRKKPKWFFDWRDRPKELLPATGGSNSWDYYSHRIKVDWSGWKHFSLKKSDFTPTRKPIGWGRINYISFSASGWGLEPDPGLVLCLDDVKLVGKETKQLATFEDESDFERWSGLKPTKEIAKAGDASGKWEFMQINPRVMCRRIPHDWSHYDSLDFWLYSSSACDAGIQLVLDSDVPDMSRVDDTIMKHIYGGTFLGKKIDWEMNPVDPKLPEYTPEWTYGLNRFAFWRTLGEAYWATGDEKYAREWVAQMTSWIHDEPVPYEAGPGRPCTWRTIECGIRTAGSWMDAYFYFLGSPSFTSEAHTMFLKSMREHAIRLAKILVRYPERTGNWLTMECNGLAHVAIMFPEFKESREWLKLAFDRLDLEMDRQIYPDGCQIELTTGYHCVCIHNFLGAARIAKLNGVAVPGDYMKKLELLYHYLLYVMMPDGTTPPLNDGNRVNARRYLAQAAELYGRKDFEWAGSNGVRGTPPDHTSHAFRYGGQFVMRSGWQPDDLYLLLDAGPFGAGHQHEDCLSVYVYGLGRVLVTEPGNYRYDHSKWRRHVLSTEAHNTILVDGQGQHRRGLKETYIVEEPLPNEWSTSDSLDYAAGTYRWGYGEKRDKSVTHTRHVVFVKPDYWVVYDVLDGKGRHRLESLYHLDADEAVVDPGTKSVRTVCPGKANLLLLPLAAGDLSVKIVKGQEDPVQGWIPSRKRPIPTAIYRRETECPATFVHVLYPYKQPEPPVVEMRSLPAKRDGKELKDYQALVVEVKRDDSRRDIVMISHAGAGRTRFGDYVTDAAVALVRLKESKVSTAAVVNGTFLNEGKKPLLKLKRR